MNYMINWIQDYWAMIILIFVWQAGVIVPTVLGIIKIITKKAEQKANDSKLVEVVNVLKKERNTLQLVLSGLELLINNLGSETLRKRYQALKDNAQAAEEEIEGFLDKLTNSEVFVAAKDLITKTKNISNEVESIDTNKTAF